MYVVGAETYVISTIYISINERNIDYVVSAETYGYPRGPEAVTKIVKMARWKTWTRKK